MLGPDTPQRQCSGSSSGARLGWRGAAQDLAGHHARDADDAHDVH